MKKQYHQPKLYAETFALAEHIGANCTTIMTFGVGCVYGDDTAGTMFATEACGTDAMEMWQNFSPTPDDWTMENVGQLGLDCYNTFSNFSKTYTS